MWAKGGSEHRISCENPQIQHYRTSWVQPSRTEFNNIPQIDWACPPRFLVDPKWKMEAGSESQETHIQLHRESRIAEAIYYHKSGIPPNPYEAPHAHDVGSKVPVAPLDVVNDGPSPNGSLIPPCPTVKVGEKTTQSLLPRDEVIKTAAALVTLIRSKEPGSQIDLELLIQLLSNPGMLEKLTKEHGLPANQSSVTTSTSAQPHGSSVPLPQRPTAGGYNTWSPSESQNPSSNKNTNAGKTRKLINEYRVHLGDKRVKPGITVVKDADYYRRLISLHGMVQDNGKPQRSVKPTGSREQRPCAYFNSPKGCRLGSSCLFQHVKGGFGRGGQSVGEQQGAKRMKFARHT